MKKNFFKKLLLFFLLLIISNVGFSQVDYRFNWGMYYGFAKGDSVYTDQQVVNKGLNGELFGFGFLFGVNINKNITLNCRGDFKSNFVSAYQGFSYDNYAIKLGLNYQVFAYKALRPYVFVNSTLNNIGLELQHYTDYGIDYKDYKANVSGLGVEYGAGLTLRLFTRYEIFVQAAKSSNPIFENLSFEIGTKRSFKSINQ